MWNIVSLDNNVFRITQNDRYVEFKAIYDKAINLNSKNMSKDGVVFISQSYPTPEDDTEAVVGKALEYKDGICIQDKLISVSILKSNINNPKACVESFFI